MTAIAFGSTSTGRNGQDFIRYWIFPLKSCYDTRREGLSLARAHLLGSSQAGFVQRSIHVSSDASANRRSRGKKLPAVRRSGMPLATE